MEFKLTQPESVRMMEIWYDELRRTPGVRAVENGAIKLDSVPSARGAVHTMDGAVVQVWYRAANEPTARQIREASVAVQVMSLPRQLYTGKLIDIKKGADGTCFFMVRAIERRDESDQGNPGYRCFNPSKGTLIEMTINPSAASLAAGQAAAARIQSASGPQPVAPQPPDSVVVAPVQAGMVVRRRRPQ